MKKPPDQHYRHRLPAELISHAVWLYHLFSLSFRDVELLLSERGIFVSYEEHPPVVSEVWRELREQASSAPTQAR
jgi:transposase-like protein